MEQGYFVTGTDTNVGKTIACLALMSCLQAQNDVVVGMKPIASGCILKQDKWVNEDALLLQKNSSIDVSYEKINPYSFDLPVSPHIAAKVLNQIIDFDHIKTTLNALKLITDKVIVEGVGGWLVPIDERRDISDLAAFLGLPVILVVGLKLGCINHALLSYEAIERRGLNCKGWIANHLERDLLCSSEIVATIESRLKIPLLGAIPLMQQGKDIDQMELSFKL